MPGFSAGERDEECCCSWLVSPDDAGARWRSVVYWPVCRTYWWRLCKATGQEQDLAMAEGRTGMGSRRAAWEAPPQHAGLRSTKGPCWRVHKCHSAPETHFSLRSFRLHLRTQPLRRPTFTTPPHCGRQGSPASPGGEVGQLPNLALCSDGARMP